ncbi:unnamed protein product [Cuscuta epithymum]|uniref:Uncharacterized protein n=1 Tax=Cuscuta epithymum TaxID=186058 RepID=A0AAV0C948_9ASTE|nr:unnamed protein product [Cuscuta epithymum]
MGSWFSSLETRQRRREKKKKTHTSAAAADVILTNGELRRFSVPVRVSQVLFSGTEGAPAFFVCNSDRLCFDEHIPAMAADDELEAGQIYFILPVNKLLHRLAGSDMAALAVKASAALRNNQNRHRDSKRMSGTRNICRISPVIGSGIEASLSSSLSSSSSSGLGVDMRKKAVMRMQRYSSRRAKIAVRSFRLKLMTIQEDG